jgi:hypothetical protein
MTVPTIAGILAQLDTSPDAASTSVTQVLLKGFTGRGRAHARLHAMHCRTSEQLTLAANQMDVLSQRTKDVEQALWILKVYRRADGQGIDGHPKGVKLHWAMRTSGAHVNWSVLADQVNRLPRGMRVWYEDANFLGALLNMLWSRCYQELDMLERLIDLDTASTEPSGVAPTMATVGALHPQPVATGSSASRDSSEPSTAQRESRFGREDRRGSLRDNNEPDGKGVKPDGEVDAVSSPGRLRTSRWRS